MCEAFFIQDTVLLDRKRRLRSQLGRPKQTNLHLRKAFLYDLKCSQTHFVPAARCRGARIKTNTTTWVTRHLARIKHCLIYRKVETVRRVVVALAQQVRQPWTKGDAMQ